MTKHNEEKIEKKLKESSKPAATFPSITCYYTLSHSENDRDVTERA